MPELHHHRVRRRLLILAALLGFACSPKSRANPGDDGAYRYLETTKDELGVDVVVLLDAIADLGDARAGALAAALWPSVRPADAERFGRLMSLRKLPMGNTPVPPAAAGSPDPTMTGAGADGVADRCLAAAVSCALPQACLDYVARDDQWGTSLTHQAAVLLFARWSGCALPATEATRARLAARLHAEIHADPKFTDLGVERLAMLAALGYRLDPRWIQGLSRSRLENGCFGEGGRCHPHVTALAMWTLAMAKAVKLGENGGSK